MKGSALLAWFLLAAWAVWLFAAQGRWAAATASAWVPEIGLSLLLGLGPSLRRGDLVAAAFAIAAARIAVSIEPPAAVLAGYLAAGVVAQSVQSVIPLDRPAVRIGLGFALALSLDAWFALVAGARGQGALVLEADLVLAPWRRALVTALLAGFVGPLFARLPGLTPLRKRRTWSDAVSFT